MSKFIIAMNTVTVLLIVSLICLPAPLRSQIANTQSQQDSPGNWAGRFNDDDEAAAFYEVVWRNYLISSLGLSSVFMYDHLAVGEARISRVPTGTYLVVSYTLRYDWAEMDLVDCLLVQFQDSIEWLSPDKLVRTQTNVFVPADVITVCSEQDAISLIAEKLEGYTFTVEKLGLGERWDLGEEFGIPHAFVWGIPRMKPAPCIRAAINLCSGEVTWREVACEMCGLFTDGKP